MSKALQEDCTFIAGFGEASAKERITGENILFKDKIGGSAVRILFREFKVNFSFSQSVRQFLSAL